MKCSYIFFAFVVCSLSFINAQVGIGNTNPNATLDISSSNQVAPRNTDGILIPKIDNFPTSNPTVLQDGMLVYITGNSTPTKGFYYWDNVITNWVSVTNKSGWQDTGNAGTNSSVNFVGTTDAQDLTIRTNNIEKLRLTQKGQLEVLNTGSSTFIGNNAGESEDLGTRHNTFVGAFSGENTTVGGFNSFYGSQSGRNNVNGVFNSFFGFETGRDNTANSNSFFGYRAGNLNATGNTNSFFGTNTGANNSTGFGNSFFGSGSGNLNSIGTLNSFFGENAAINNLSGSENIAIGVSTLANNTIGNRNIAIGRLAGSGSIGSSKSGGVFIGHNAGQNEDNDDRLYIENTPSSSPLIYGEFDNDILRVNGALQVNNPATTGYALPNTDGTAGQVLQTDGNGALTFANAPDADTEWSKIGNAGTNSTTNFVGTTDAQDLSFRTNNQLKMRLSQKGQLEFLNTGNSIFVGENSGVNDDDTTNQNTYVGTSSGRNNISGSNNSFFGMAAGRNNIAGSSNSFFGSFSGRDTTGGSNSFFGFLSGANSTTGNANSFFGVQSGQSNTGDFNSFFGSLSGFGNITGQRNSFFGNNSGLSNSIGSNNTAIGYDALSSISNGSFNIAVGDSAMKNSNGGSNIGIGNSAFLNGSGSFNISIGSDNGIDVVGNQNIFIGNGSAGSSVSSNISGSVFIGNNSGRFETNSHRLYIENSNANANDALIYGEFDNNLLRTNAELQVGSPGNAAIDGRIQIFSDAGSAVDINPLVGYVFNEQGLNADFRVEGNTVTHLLFADAGLDVLKVGRAATTLTGNGTTVNGAVIKYTADFEHQNGTLGSAIGIGNSEYIADVGLNILATRANFVPSLDNTFDLGLPNLRWDDVRATNGVIVTSDITQKENISEITYGLNEILQLNPIKYQWKNDYDRNFKLGLSAQQLQQLIPEVVKDYHYEHLEDGSAPVKKQTDLLGVYYSDIIPVLVKAIQEQDEKIKSLEERLETLENK